MRVALGLFLLLTACSGAGTPEVDPVAQDLAAHQLGWEQQQLLDYTWTYRAGRYGDFPGEVTVTVEDGRVVDTVHDEPAGRQVRVMTAEAVFALARNALAWHSADIEYDGATCVPSRMYLDEEEGLADDEISFSLVEFAARNGSVGSCMPIPATTECPDLTGRSFVASEEQIAEGGGTHRPSFEFITAELIEYNGSDYIDEIALRCENGSLVEVEQWASLSFDGDNVVIERGNERLVASRPTAGSACEGLFGGYGPTTDDPLILELEVKANDITFLFNDGNVVTIQYECAGETIWRRTFHGWHLVDGRILWGGDFFSSTG